MVSAITPAREIDIGIAREAAKSRDIPICSRGARVRLSAARQVDYDRNIVADATPDLPEEEKNLQALLRSLKVCLIWSRERAEKIACLELDGYLDSLENEFQAQAAFDDDVDHAEEVLAWRATVVADLVGAALSIYARTRSPLDDPWMAWRREPPSEPAVAFVCGLTEDAFFCARVAYHTHSDLEPRPK
jgi:hypothetical protein